MSDATRQSRLNELRAERRAAVDVLDPDALDDWPLERIVDLAEEVGRLQAVLDEMRAIGFPYTYLTQLTMIERILRREEDKS